MCGFVVAAGIDVDAVNKVQSGIHAIEHRGPDGIGHWNDSVVAMAHARLAILDLSNRALQPMRSANGKATIVFNGEIYNYRELSKRVHKLLRTTSDTEVLLELLEQEGKEAISKIRGMFAFAYWDGETLLVVRDRIGIKPLFYSVNESTGSFAAASEIGALVAMGVTTKQIDFAAIDAYLSYLYIPPPRTGIVGTFQLPPGHWLEWNARTREIKIERYWSLPSQVASNVSADEVEHSVEEAVRTHLVSDVPIGVFLSGGIDSSAIVACAAPHYPGKLKTFSIAFGNEGKRLDERKFARQVAEQYDTEHLEIEVRADVASILPKMVKHFGQPFGNPTATLSYTLSCETRKHVKVALAGDGGDEVLGGYPRYMGAWALQKYQRSPKTFRNVMTKMASQMPPSEFGSFVSWIKRFIDRADLPLEEAYFRWVTYLDASKKNVLFKDRFSILGEDRSQQEFAFLSQVRADVADVPMQDAVGLIDIGSFLPQNVLNYGDRMSMAHGLEVRVPFCDHILIEKLAALPIESKMPFGMQKGLFRWAMRNKLPKEILLHKKIGFNPPIAQWFQMDLAVQLNDALSDDVVRRRGIFNLDAVRQMRNELNGGNPQVAHPLWALVVLEEWMRWLGV